MKKTIVAPVGDHIDDIYVGIREFPTGKVILLSSKEFMKQADKTKASLEKFKIPTSIVEVDGHVWEAMFKKIAELKAVEGGELIINPSTGDRHTRCAATSAAFVNGLKAFVVDGDDIMMLPTLKFSYYNILSDKKMKLLELLYKEKDCCLSLEDVSKKSKMSVPLVSYHLNGTLKSEGLKEMELVHTEEQGGKTCIKLTFLGKMLLKGYIKPDKKK